MRLARVIGLITILALATGAVLLWFVTPTRASRYAGESGSVRALVSVTGAAPERVTCDVGGVKIDAHKLP
jgi:hypothetical protein